MNTQVSKGERGFEGNKTIGNAKIDTEIFSWYLSQTRAIRNTYAQDLFQKGMLTFVRDVTAEQKMYLDQDGIEVTVTGDGKRIDDFKVEATSYGRLIEIGSGDLDFKPHQAVREAMTTLGQNNKEIFKYPSTWGIPAFGSTVSAYLKRWCNIVVTPNRIMPCCGAYQGIQTLLYAFLKLGDQIVVPQPGFSAIRSVSALQSIQVLPTLLDHNGLVNLTYLDRLLMENPRVKMIYLNYPSNPTGIIASNTFFAEVVEIAKQRNVIVINDMEDLFMSHTGEAVRSFLEAPGAMDIGVEFHTFSKGHGLAGLRLGFVAGNQSIIDGMRSYADSSLMMVPPLAQYAGIAAMNHPPIDNESIVAKRMDAALQLLHEMGWNIKRPDYGYNLWIPIPDVFASGHKFSEWSLQNCEVGVAPGEMFGVGGEKFVRLTLQAPNELIKEALHRWQKTGIRYKHL